MLRKINCEKIWNQIQNHRFANDLKSKLKLKVIFIIKIIKIISNEGLASAAAVHQTYVLVYHQIPEASGLSYIEFYQSIFWNKDSKPPCSDKSATQHLICLWTAIHQIPQCLASSHGHMIHPTALLIPDFAWINQCLLLPPNSRSWEASRTCRDGVAILCPFLVDVANWFLNVFIIFLFVAVLASRVAYEGFLETWHNAKAGHTGKKWFLIFIKVIKSLNH